MANAMTYSDIRDIMVSKGIASDPAFQKVNFAIVDKQLPCLEEGCPLGLYFPEKEYIKELGLVPERTIVIPYDCSEGVLLHELGHHWGNWYQHNLTEKFAEDFRRKYGGAQAIMACGKMTCGCGTCRLETGWSCVPRMRSSVGSSSVASLEGACDFFQVSLVGGAYSSQVAQEVLVNQPFSIRVHYKVSNAGVPIWLVFDETVLRDGVEQWISSDGANFGADAPYGFHYGFLYLNFPNGLSQTGQWGLKVDMYVGPTPVRHDMSLLKSQTFNPVVVVRPQEGFWVWYRDNGMKDLPDDGTRPDVVMPIIGQADLPAELQSGQAFRPHFWVSYWSTYAFDTINLKVLFNNKVVGNFDYLTYGMPPLNPYGPTYAWRKYGFAFYLDFKQIESILGHVPDKDELQSLAVRVRTTAIAGETTFLHESPVVPWNVHITVPQVQMSNVAFPETIQKGTPFSISLLALFQPTVWNCVYLEDYLEAEYLGTRKRLWTRIFPPEHWDIMNRPTTSWQSVGLPGRPDLPGVDIESILGPVTQSGNYALSLHCGTIAGGTIAGTGVAWQRVSEAGVSLNPYVAVTAPIPALLDQPESLFPPAFINVDEVTQIIIGLENYGAEGDIYLNLNEVEVWRQNLGLGDKGFWDSGLKTIGQILGQTITESQEVQLNFVYGFLDSAGQKIPSPARRFTVYVMVPAATATLFGYVTNINGAAIQGATVALGNRGATTAMDGYYEVTGLVAQLYVLSCEKEGYQTYQGKVLILAGENRHDVTLSPEAEVAPSKFPIAPIALGLAGVVVSAIAIVKARRGRGKR